jgi:hypothetical protein
MTKWIGQSYIAILIHATFYWAILFFYIVGIGVASFFATIAIFIRWLESKQKRDN